MVDLSQKDMLLEKQSKYIKSLRQVCLYELKRRIQILKLSNADKLLSKIGIKITKQGKFDQEDEELNEDEKPTIDYVLRI